MTGKWLIILAGVGLLLHTGCANYLYAPAINLSEKQLVKGEFDVKGSIGSFPETQTPKINTTIAGSIDLGYGFSRHINLYGSAWRNLTDEHPRGGMALASRVRLVETAKSQLLLYPRAAILFRDNNFHTYGFELPVIYLRSFSPKLYAYSGIGYLYGIHTGDDSFSGENLWGIIGHVGVGYHAGNAFRIMLELNPVYQYNNFNGNDNFLLSPTITAGYILNRPQNRSKFSGQKYKEK